MELSVERVDVWAATIEDKPGGLAQVLGALRDAGADLQFVVARRTPESPGKGVVFVAPLQGDQEIHAATQVGFNVTPSLHSVRVMGLDQLGIIAELTQRLADGGINLR
ncbi:ACT domain-containing protein, partial [Paraburkholderia piptadeniae]